MMIEEENDELNLIRKRKMQQYDTSNVIEAEPVDVYDTQKQHILREILTPEAKSRLSTLKLVKPVVAQHVEEYLIALIQSGKFNQKINEEMIKKILINISSKKKEIRIRRK